MCLSSSGLSAAITVATRCRSSSWEKIYRALIIRTCQAGKDLVVSKRVDGQVQLRVSRDADVCAAQCSTHQVLCNVVGCHKDLVKVSTAGTPGAAAVDADLAEDVRAVAGGHPAYSGESLRINCLAKAVVIQRTSVDRALHLDVECRDVVIDEVLIHRSRLRDTRCYRNLRSEKLTISPILRSYAAQRLFLRK